MRNVRLDAIQVLRLFAALLVVFDHATADMMAAGKIAENFPFAFRSGGFGVHIFFLISGFVMAHSMYGKFGTPDVWWDFLRRRVVRIVPMYWLVTTLIVAKAAVTTGQISVQPFLLSLLFIPYMQPSGVVQPINGVGWTLNFEMQFYLIFVVSLLFSRSVGAILLSAVLILLVALGSYFTMLPGTEFGRTAVGFWTDPILLYFLGGVWIGFIRAWRERRGPIVEVAMSKIIVATLTAIVAYEALLYHMLMPKLLEALFATTIVAALSMMNSEAHTQSDLVLKRLGDASYSTYLIHLFVISALTRIGIPNWLPLPPVTFVVIALLTAAFSGLLVYQMLERPILKYLQKMVQRTVHAPSSV